MAVITSMRPGCKVSSDAKMLADQCMLLNIVSVYRSHRIPAIARLHRDAASAQCNDQGLLANGVGSQRTNDCIALTA